MTKLSIITISLGSILVLYSTRINAQQDVLFTQFSNAKNHFNPATSGLNYKYQACALAREQWDGVNGAPSTQLINYSMKIDKINSGVGINYFHDKIGFSESNTVKLNYSYHLKFKNEQILSFGLSVGMMNYKMTATWVTPTTTQDPFLPPNINDTKFTTDFGIAYSIKKLNIGLSSTHLTQERFTSTYSSYQSARHFYGFFDYTFGNEEKMQFRPEVLVMSDRVKISSQINLVGILKDKYYLGLGFRTSDALIAMIGWDIKKKFRIAYSYDLTINKLSTVSKGSHEFVIGFYLK